MKLDSWRTNAAPPPPRPGAHKSDSTDVPPPKAPTPVSKPPPNFVTSLFTADMSLKPDEDTEVLDFSELSRLAPPEAAQVNADAQPAHSPTESRPPVQLLQRPPGAPPPGRPAPPMKSDSNAWRKPLTESPQLATIGPGTLPPNGSAQPAAPPPSVWARRPPGPEPTVQRAFPPPTSVSRSPEAVAPTSPTTSPIRKHGRTISNEPVSPRQAPYKEAPLSALTDTMSRIKGALAGMQDAKGKEMASSQAQSPESVSTSTTKPGAIPSVWREREAKALASRPKAITETPTLTRIALVLAPQPGEPSRVRLPAVLPRETATKKQLHLWNSPTQVRFEILSYDPPVKGMSRRTLAIEDTLFDKPKVKQGATLYKVTLPTQRLVNPRALAKIEIPERQPTLSGGLSSQARPPLVGSQGKPPSATTFGRAGGSLFGVRSRGVDEDSWRKPAAPKAPESVAQTELNPVSRSPPPEPESKPASSIQAATSSPVPARLGLTGDAPKTPPVLSSHWGQSPLSLPIINSPSRQAPDPEHLKQVWSQKLDKDGKPSANSLQGIADEPTPLSFTMQEMKSEDGETPPPTMSSSSHSGTSVTRMSVADAHRAFQTVPTPSSSSSSPQPPHRSVPPAQSSSSHLTASPARPPPPAMPMRMFYPQPPPGTTPQPTPGPHLYAPAHPQQFVPRPAVNGTAPPPQMAQGWVLAPAGAQQQQQQQQQQQPQQQQFLRPPPPGSPYGAVQMVAYGPPPGAMYGPPHPPGQSPHLMPKPMPPMAPGPPGAGRGRGIPMMSPAPGPAPHLSPVPPPGHIVQAPMGMGYQGGPIPSIYHMPQPGPSMGPPQQHHLHGQPMQQMYPGMGQRPPMMQYPSGGFMPAPPPPPPFGRPNWQ
ncbi:hypothetical protein EXIGLDRAFT_512032 [Exidia glandulosa HHB12029]|uniref:Uncharacterized protein n=1 Tax=Exidia glandulosa HHB12029 TaxID=1314781 RepID=A0A166BKZ1_EXIGL|nr:hypothetical protein EXIGLDRAFT_512032 [Exidia glandulosa HHB12029]